MATVTYTKTSPYYTTDVYGFFLDVTQFRDIPSDPNDIVYQIDHVYDGRPDLLAFDLYGDSALWWVFSMRNPDVIKDPVFDFVSGALIYVPKRATIQSALGV